MDAMLPNQSTRFVRFPTRVLEALLRTGLAGVQWCVLLWVIRGTWGWNRQWVRFTWYRIAKDLELNRGTVYRSGARLVERRLLVLREQRVAVETDIAKWATKAYNSSKGDNVASAHRCQCPQATVSRRTKDSSKDKRLNIYSLRRNRDLLRPSAYDHAAGAASPIPGKYDGISKD
jgi:phage replication O-like protein O